MKIVPAFLLIAALAAPAYAGDAADAGLAAVNDLGTANGQALACDEKDVVARAKALMLQYAPKTSRFGDAFETATRQGFMDQVKSGVACPDARGLATKVENIALRLKAALPAAN